MNPAVSHDLLPRRARAIVDEALADTRVVLINGARQSGKSTLARAVGRDIGGQWRSLDNAAARSSAENDPVTFVDHEGLLIIDEVQRVPELMLAIKETVDEDPRPGRFLLTGSARLVALRSVPDALPGRMETIELWPLAQVEIDRSDSRSFVDAAFAGDAQIRHTSSETRTGYLGRIVRGGFPEAVVRGPRRRTTFFDNYVGDLVNREVRQASAIERTAQMSALIRLLAARSGQLLVPGHLASDLGLPQVTVSRYIELLQDVFLIKRIPAWSRNISTRAIGTSKVAMVDSGVAASLLGLVAMEIARILTWSDATAQLFHYRTKDGVEVDLVLENRQGDVVAIEVKASATAKAEHFRGIDHIRSRIGDDFVAGIVLYLGTETLPFGDGKLAVPVSALWDL